MKITCALLVLALASYANAGDTVLKCHSDTIAIPGGCLDSASSACPGTAVNCKDAAPNTPDCKVEVTLANWVASRVTRTCVASGACTAADATTASGTQTACVTTSGPAGDVTNKGPLKCFKCANCAAAQSPGTNEFGGWNFAVGCKLCYIKVTISGGTISDVVRDCSTTTAPTGTPYNAGTATGDVVTSCTDAMLCNKAAGSTIAPAVKCQGDVAAGSGLCLNPAATAGCATAVNCADTTPQCKITVKLENWVAKSVARTCVAAGTGASGCSATDSSTATGDQIVCETGTTTDVSNKGPLKCYKCTACAGAQTAGTNEFGGWSEATGCKECWIKANYVAGTKVGHGLDQSAWMRINPHPHGCGLDADLLFNFFCGCGWMRIYF